MTSLSLALVCAHNQQTFNGIAIQNKKEPGRGKAKEEKGEQQSDMSCNFKKDIYILIAWQVNFLLLLLVHSIATDVKPLYLSLSPSPNKPNGGKKIRDTEEIHYIARSCQMGFAICKEAAKKAKKEGEMMSSN